MTRIIEIEGIGTTFAAKLSAAGISTVESLLATGASPAGRRRIAAQIGVDDSRVLEWVNRADLMRIKGIGSEFADLLEASGVDSVPELSRRNAENLIQVLLEINEAKKITRRTPALNQVQRWITDAKELPRVVTH